MKVIIIEVTRAANSFGRTHLPEIRQAYDQVAQIVAEAQADGASAPISTPTSSAWPIYGAIEQVLSGWVFELKPSLAEEFDAPARWSSS